MHASYHAHGRGRAEWKLVSVPRSRSRYAIYTPNPFSMKTISPPSKTYTQRPRDIHPKDHHVSSTLPSKWCLHLYNLRKLGRDPFSFSGLCSQPLLSVFRPRQGRRVRLLRFPVSSLGPGEIFVAVQQRLSTPRHRSNARKRREVLSVPQLSSIYNIPEIQSPLRISLDVRLWISVHSEPKPQPKRLP